MEHKWRSALVKDSDGQVVRILRPDEAKELLDNIDVEYEKGTTSRKWLRDVMSSSDVREWCRFLLYSGVRFPEAVRIHANRDLVSTNGTIFLPFRSGQKEKIKAKSRTIYLSDYGRRHLKDFFNAANVRAKDLPEMKQTLTSLTQILHATGEAIGLPFIPGLQKVVKHPVKDSNGNQVVEVKGGKTVKVYREEYIYPKTNGVCVRSFRKTWESWVMMTEGSDPIKMGMVAHSQGHELITAGEHYINFGFTESEKEEIKPYTENYGPVEFVFTL